MKRAALFIAAALALPGCSVIVKGSPLSNRPEAASGMYLSTGTASRPFETLGFVQVTGYGVEVAGLVDVGEAALDGPIRVSLVQAAQQMGGDGVIHIDFLDTNPSTPAERAQAAAETTRSLATGQGEVKTKDRRVIVTGQVIKFKAQ